MKKNRLLFAILSITSFVTLPLSLSAQTPSDRQLLRYSRQRHYADFSRWSLGADFGLPFFSGDISSLADGKTYIGTQFTIQGSYQMNPYLGVKLSATYGGNKAGSRSYSMDYLLGPDAMTYYPPTPMEGTKYADLYSRIQFFSVGAHLGLNLNRIVGMDHGARLLTVIFEPGIYLQKFSATAKLKTGGRAPVKKLDNPLHIGLGGDLLFRFHVNKNIDLQFGGGVVYIPDNDFDGIRTLARARDSFSWNTRVGIILKLNGKKYRDNLLYGAYLPGAGK